MSEPLPETVALEYLVSAACNFVVELHEEPAGAFLFRPSARADASRLGDFARGQRFARLFDSPAYPTPLQAAVMYVNAVKVWDAGGAAAPAPPGQPDQTFH